uniref:Phytocyanin domain-containing protein n=1 Tax=Oryza punctata TaxID=4537 RepID=A0A0E0LER3_ORYPU
MAGAVASVSLGLAWLGLMVAAASAMQFRVGGGRGWSVPDANAEPYNSWAGRMRFQIGDQLLFVYPKEMDAVVVVDQGAYDACNTSSSSVAGGGGRFDDGNTVFTFDRSGPFFFISGNEANCRAGEKLIVVVMADRSGRHAPPPAAVPPPVAPVPMPSPASSPPSPAPAAATPSMAPSPVAMTPSPSPSVSPMAPAPAPTTSTPSSPPAPAAMAPSPSTTPGGVAQPPPPGTEGANATTPAAPAANDRSGATAPAVAGAVATSLGAYIGYAMLAI